MKEVLKIFFSYLWENGTLFQNYGKLKRVIRHDLYPSKSLEFS